MKKYFFEYNEKEGNFHQNFGTSKPNTMGYQTICECEEYIWDPFNHWIHKRYDFCHEDIPSFELIHKEWNNYIELREEINQYNRNVK